MPLTAGTRLGPYEILAPLGAGGMGEVYRARDTRLGREVAVKVLPSSFAKDPERLHRFEQEARAASSLNHPNILAIYDIGQSDGAPYVVSELLEGETLGERLRTGGLNHRKAVELAIQIARGLTAAHEKGIVHRDLKPDNTFVTRDGHVKILDFGLAKLTRPEVTPDSATQAGTVSIGTEPGKVMGTVGYMSPEQVRGEAADQRSDIFSFGSILYEMLAGKRAFQRDTSAETMTAILKEEPLELSGLGRNLAPALERVVDHCLEKRPEARFQSARDLAFALEALSGVTASVSEGVAAVPAPQVSPASRRILFAVVGTVGLIIASTIAFMLGRRSEVAPSPSFHRITFRRGEISTARFAPDGETVIYSAAWDGAALEIFSATPPSPESRALGFTRADVLSISKSGQLALSLDHRATGAWTTKGTLSVASLTGGAAPHAMLEGVEWADWSPGGTDLAVVREANGGDRLEYPIGTVLDQTNGWFSHPRFSPSGQMIAYIDHVSRAGDPGSIVVVSLDGNHKRSVLATGWNSALGLAWAPSGNEVWFTATTEQSGRALYAANLAGTVRLVNRVPGNLVLQDISSSGRTILTNDNMRTGVIALAPGAKTPRDLSWLDFSALRDMSADGRTILFDEAGEAWGQFGAIYLRKTDGSPPVHLNAGLSTSLSSDGQWVLADLPPTSTKTEWQLSLLPAGPGEAKVLKNSSGYEQWSELLPGAKQVLFAESLPGHGVRLYVLPVGGGQARPISPEGVSLVPYAHSISPDAQQVIAISADQSFALYSTETGERRAIVGLSPGQVPFGWTGDGRSLYVYQPGEIPARVFRLDLATGHSTPVQELMPPDPAGITFIRPPHFSGDGKAYAYSYTRLLSDLYEAEGLK